MQNTPLPPTHSSSQTGEPELPAFRQQTATRCTPGSNSTPSQHRTWTTDTGPLHSDSISHSLEWEFTKATAPAFVIQILPSFPTVFSNQPPRAEPQRSALPASSGERNTSRGPEGSSTEPPYPAAHTELQACQYQSSIDSTGPSVPLNFVFQQNPRLLSHPTRVSGNSGRLPKERRFTQSLLPPHYSLCCVRCNIATPAPEKQEWKPDRDGAEKRWPQTTKRLLTCCTVTLAVCCLGFLRCWGRGESVHSLRTQSGSCFNRC